MDRSADLNRVVHSHSVGFLAYDRSGRGLTSRSAGSGTLVEFLGIRGIVTAAHVAAVLRNLPEVGIMRFGSGQTYESLICSGGDLEVTTVGSEPFGEDGPDLAFLRLPHELEERLAVTNAYFNSLVRAKLLKKGQARRPVDLTFVTGVVSELSRSLGVEGNFVRTEHASINGVGEITDVAVGDDGIDRLDFRLWHHDDFPAPSSYEGVSGGGLWQLGKGSDLLDRTLIGVAYYESEADEQGHRVLKCHGPLAVHEVLYLAVLDRYAPDQAAAHRATPWP